MSIIVDVAFLLICLLCNPKGTEVLQEKNSIPSVFVGEFILFFVAASKCDLLF